MVGLAGTSYVGKQYDITCKVNGYLPDGSSEETSILYCPKKGNNGKSSGDHSSTLSSMTVQTETEKGRKLELLIVMKVTFHHCAQGCVGNRLKERSVAICCEYYSTREQHGSLEQTDNFTCQQGSLNQQCFSLAVHGALKRYQNEAVQETNSDL